MNGSKKPKLRLRMVTKSLQLSAKIELSCSGRVLPECKTVRMSGLRNRSPFRRLPRKVGTARMH